MKRSVVELSHILHANPKSKICFYNCNGNLQPIYIKHFANLHFKALACKIYSWGQSNEVF